MSRKLFSIAVLIAAMFLQACGSDGDTRREEYLDADYYTRLELPPDLTAPEALGQELAELLLQQGARDLITIT